MWITERISTTPLSRVVVTSHLWLCSNFGTCYCASSKFVIEMALKDDDLQMADANEN
jgi:hypothetical protein